jgi:hypothetical protein
MTKPDPKIIRVGDMVKIINPEMFVRCGYPMDMMQARNESWPIYSDLVIKLLATVGMDRHKFHKVEIEIMDALAYGYMKKKGFGGVERTIHSKQDEYWRGFVGKVEKIKFFKTGTYVPGYRSHGPDDYDYDPPFLRNQSTHKVLLITNDQYGLTWIESVHVKKIEDEANENCVR